MCRSAAEAFGTKFLPPTPRVFRLPEILLETTLIRIRRRTDKPVSGRRRLSEVPCLCGLFGMYFALRGLGC
jgi:hypothetical protein